MQRAARQARAVSVFFCAAAATSGATSGATSNTVFVTASTASAAYRDAPRREAPPFAASDARFENRSHGRVAEGRASRGFPKRFGTTSRGGVAGGVEFESGFTNRAGAADRGIATGIASNDAVSCGVGGGTFGGGSHDDSPVLRLQ